jgi:peptidoglycan glycosyltransferase
MAGELPAADARRLQRQLARLSRTLLAGFIVVGAALVYWSVMRAESILAREDNPRLVEAELRIQRGRILDRADRVLAESIGPAARLQRHYPLAGAGPAVGYYSFRHGASGIEESYDGLLRGDSADFWLEWWRLNMHQPQTGRDVRLTLDTSLQDALAALHDGRPGALLLLQLPRAEILALVSQPAFDPNRLDELFEELTSDESAPLLNRVTQGQYQPGLLLEPLILSAALDRGVIRLDDPVAEAEQAVAVQGRLARCAQEPPQPATWLDVLVNRCPGPLPQLGQQLGNEALGQIFSDFGLYDAPELPLDFDVEEPAAIVDPGMASIGQEQLTVTPLQIALAWAALGVDGRLPVPQLVTAAQDEAGEWQSVAPDNAFFGTAVSVATARALRNALTSEGAIAEFTTLVLSGPGGSTNGWYLGLAPADAPRYAVVVVVEESSDVAAATGIGREALRLALRE